MRLIVATSQDLAAKVENGSFRRDLFYRLNVLPIEIPSLRGHLVDLRPLSEALLEQLAVENNMRLRQLDSAAPKPCNPSLPQRVASLEREAILAALQSTKGKKAPVARLLGISRSTLMRRSAI